MITVKIHGGLGNQIFEYAAARALSVRTKQEMTLDPAPLYDITPRKDFQRRDYELNKEFRIDPPQNLRARWAERIKIPYFDTIFNKAYPSALARVGYWQYIKEKSAAFEPEVVALRGSAYLDGYWQSERYFEDCKGILRAELVFRNPIARFAAVLAEEIAASVAVCVHVRRGDYVSIAKTASIHQVVDEDYYRRAVAILKERYRTGLKAFVFSDDIAWCKEHLSFAAETIFVDERYGPPNVRDDMQLMSMCRHFIIPNSSFSWWAAWLSKSAEKVVIAPKRWFNNDIDTSDIVPPEWLRI